MTKHLAAAVATHAGCVRAANEDAFVASTTAGVWAVADGLGGHRDGASASRRVCAALGGFDPDAPLDTIVIAVRERLATLNAELIDAASQRDDGECSASTVVILIARDRHAALLWAGDSRAYRWRGGVLEPRTRDHRPSPADIHAVTRAVGADETLTLDVVRDELHDGDRFLLCSDGLTQVVSEAEIRTAMAAPQMTGIADALVNAALTAGAPDNVTAVVVEVLL